MSTYSRSMVLGLAVLGLALVTAPVFAANLITINEVTSQGITGSRSFIPTFVSSGDSTGIGGTSTTAGIYIPYMGTMTPCAAAIDGYSGGVNNGGSATGCARWGQAAIEAWSSGFFYDPRFGTPFIPPSGDHHRTGYRMLMQPSFSGGQWLSGFAPLAQRFPFMPNVGTAGAGGDVGLALASASAETSLNQILELADAHGEPLTTGKFPRYWPHERAAWVDTLMVKYTAGGANVGTMTNGCQGTLPNDVCNGSETGFTQSLRSSVGFSRHTDLVRWRTMSNLDGAFSAASGQNSDGCGTSGWCEFYLTVDGNGHNHLFVVKNADADTDTADGAPVEITQSTRLDTIGALSNGGKVLKQVTLNDLEKLPTLVEDRLAQSSNDDGAFEPQTLVSQFRTYSGPNVHSEEGADPYAWVICGTRGTAYGEGDCNTGGGAIDAGGYKIAIVFNSNNPGGLGDSLLKRFGRDLNPARLLNDPNQDTGVYVVCDGVGGGTISVSGIVYNTSTCSSSPGPDGFYGSVDDGTIYYKEAIENGLRGWIRETNGHAFGFLGADNDGTHNGASAANFGLTQLVQQATEGFLMSCLNCSPHSIPAVVETITYNIDWPAVPNPLAVTHPPTSGDFTAVP
ncbi:MAG: hypothetical protein HY207_06855 [Nitrospirae bacterium]|nr:hypothetical protein [Nitrospirota bacterium]